MTQVSTFRRLSAALLGVLVFAGTLTADDRTFTTSPTLKEEASTVVKILEQAHYNRDAVRSSDYQQVIPDYMADLDAQHLFFLGTDKTEFAEKYGKGVYYNTAFLGKIDEAYIIFNRYQTRVENRVSWINTQLKGDIDVNSKDTYRVDRTKSEWPSTVADSDDLWRRRLKFEVVGELLNNKEKATDPAKANGAVVTAPATKVAVDTEAAKLTADTQALEKAKDAVRKRYERMLKNLADIEGNDLAELYLSTITRLYDPHSTYFSAESFEDFGIQMKLKLFGIGALLGLEDDYCVVKEIVLGGPADLGHQLKPNDKIISVSQSGSEPVEIIGMKLRKIVNMIRGEKGTQVHLIVQPADATDASIRKEIVITRDIVKLNSSRARAAVFQVPGSEGTTQPIGVITLPGFYNDEGDTDADTDAAAAAKDVARLITQLKGQGIQGMILDLRRNGGGFLSEAIDLAGLFIKKGPVVQVKNYNGEIQVDSDNNEGIAYAGPLAVLVDRFSASASEIVTGALQNYGRAIVIGDSSTHGKGSVQQIIDMRQVPSLARSPVKTGAVKFTIQKYYLPSGDSTQLKGVVPDIVLPSVDDYIPGIGEKDLPHALVWDKIPTSTFDGAPLDPKVLTPLRQASLERQSKLEEFSWLRKNIDRFKVREEQKLVSVNLAERKKQKEDDDAFLKQWKADKEIIAKSDFPFKEFRLSPAPPPKPKAVKKDDAKDGSSDDDDLDAEEPDTVQKADVHLREALRIVSDAITLGHNKELWASNHAPLTAATNGG